MRHSTIMVSSYRTQKLLDIVTYLIIGFIVVFALAPVAWMFITSLKSEQDILTNQLQYLPARVTFENYVNIWNRSGFPTLITNSAVVTTITLVVCLTLGSLAAYSFSRDNFRGR